MKAEFEDMQKSGQANPAAALQNFDLAGFLSGSGSSAPKSGAATTGGSAGGGKKR